MAKHKKDRVKISFISNSAEDVAGSSYLVQYKDDITMLDYGLVQCSNKLKQWTLNNANFKFKVKDINNIIISHQNIDHFGSLPRLYANGCRADIYVYKNMGKYMKLAFEDGLKINTKDAELLSNQHGKNFKLPYTEEDIEITLAHIIEVDDEQLIKISDNMSFIFHSAYHIAGANQIELIVDEGNTKKNILYTGDVGNIEIDKPFLHPFRKVNKCDVAIVETTYGGNPKSVNEKTRAKDREKLQTTIRQTCLEKKGKVLLGAFAYQRVQELMYEIYMLYKDDKSFNIPVLIDSPLAIKICNIFEDLIPEKDVELWNDIMNWENFKFINEWEDSDSAIKSNTPMIIIACSGFAENGRIRGWLQNTIGDENNTVVFVGYSSEDSLAGILKEGKKKIVEIDGLKIKNKIKVVNLLSFSSHMQHKQLLKYYSDMNCGQLFLVHGNKESQYIFAEQLSEEYAKKSKTTKVFIPRLNDVVEI